MTTKQTGQSMVETAIILPVVLLLIFGTIVVGLWLYEGVLAQVAANVGAWEGAKYYASHGLPGPEEVVGGVPSSFRNTYTDSGGPAHVRPPSPPSTAGWPYPAAACNSNARLR